MNSTQLKEKIESISPETQAFVTDLTGTEDHYEARVISSAFIGKTPMERHRMVFAILEKEIHSGEIHALTLKTAVPKSE